MSQESRATKNGFLKRGYRVIEPYIYLIPAMILFVLFTYYPFLKNIVLSTYKLNKFREIKEFVGAANYIKILTDEKFLQAIGNTIIFVATTVPVSIAIGFALALLARKRSKSSSIYEALYAMTMAISVSVVAMVFQMAFNPSMGIINKLFGLKVTWLTDPRTSLLTIIIIQIWANIGYNFIFMLSGLRRISGDVLESARIDGATGIRMLRSIIIPMVSPTLLFLLMKDIAYAMTTAAFTVILTYPIFNSGGPNGTTETIISYVYGKGIIDSNFNAAFAATTVGFVLSAVMMALSLALEKRKVNYD